MPSSFYPALLTYSSSLSSDVCMYGVHRNYSTISYDFARAADGGIFVATLC